MLERVARALCGADDECWESQSEVYLSLARHAIQAMMETTSHMEKVYYSGEWGTEELPSLSEVWPLLLTAALSEGK